jgi:outer membrane protein
MKIKQLLCLVALSTPLTVHADTLSIAVGGGVWNAAPSGTFQKIKDAAAGDPAVDVQNDLFWDTESQGYFFATLEHPIPIIPNVKLMASKIDQSGSGNTSFTFDGETYNGDVSNDFSIETLDLIAYYEILDNVVSIDIGLNIRNLKVDYNIIDTTGNIPPNTDSMNETIPMLYALVGISPITDLIISGELSYIAYSGSTISDFTAKVAYTTSFFVGFEAGYRKQKYEFDDVSGTDANLDFDGVFAGAYLKF